MKHTPTHHYEPDTVTFVAWPGAGKGTATEAILADLQKNNIPSAHCEVGAICRDHGKRQTPFGLLAKEYKDKGLLVPDEHVVPVIREAVFKLRHNAVWLMDGFPRNGNQIAPYVDLMGELGRDDVILHLKLGRDEQEQDEIVVERMIKRAEAFVAKGLEPRPEDVDPVKRAERLVEARKLLPVIEYFQKEGKLVTIDATPDKATVLENLRQRLAIRVLETADIAPDESLAREPMPRFILYPAGQSA